MAGLVQQVPSVRMRSLSFRSNVSQSQVQMQSVAAPRLARAAAAPLIIENRVAIRFTRMGRKKLPFYRIIAIDSRTRRDGRPLEFLGWYNPLSKETSLNAPSIKKWLEVGAQPSDTVAALLKKAMVLDS
uniref:30S ribosomal protein S16, chloroplastic n=1 Tax=Auxenochlorella protothecoides TaxID=3075 RepID=A0A1D1ZVS2_AUXPR